MLRVTDVYLRFRIAAPLQTLELEAAERAKAAQDAATAPADLESSQPPADLEPGQHLAHVGSCQPPADVESSHLAADVGGSGSGGDLETSHPPPRKKDILITAIKKAPLSHAFEEFIQKNEEWAVWTWKEAVRTFLEKAPAGTGRGMFCCLLNDILPHYPGDIEGVPEEQNRRKRRWNHLRFLVIGQVVYLSPLDTPRESLLRDGSIVRVSLRHFRPPADPPKPTVKDGTAENVQLKNYPGFLEGVLASMLKEMVSLGGLDTLIDLCLKAYAMLAALLPGGPRVRRRVSPEAFVAALFEMHSARASLGPRSRPAHLLQTLLSARMGIPGGGGSVPPGFDPQLLLSTNKGKQGAAAAPVCAPRALHVEAGQETSAGAGEEAEHEAKEVSGKKGRSEEREKEACEEEGSGKGQVRAEGKAEKQGASGTNRKGTREGAVGASRAAEVRGGKEGRMPALPAETAGASKGETHGGKAKANGEGKDAAENIQASGTACRGEGSAARAVKMDGKGAVADKTKGEVRLSAEGGSAAAADELGKLKAEGNKLFSEGKFEEAIQKYSKSIELDVSQIGHYSNRSAAYLQLAGTAKRGISSVQRADLYKKAIADASRCIELNPEWLKGYYRLGMVHEAMGDAVGAFNAYTHGLYYDPSNKELSDRVRRLDYLPGSDPSIMPDTGLPFFASKLLMLQVARPSGKNPEMFETFRHRHVSEPRAAEPETLGRIASYCIAASRDAEGGASLPGAARQNAAGTAGVQPEQKEERKKDKPTRKIPVPMQGVNLGTGGRGPEAQCDLHFHPVESRFWSVPDEPRNDEEWEEECREYISAYRLRAYDDFCAGFPHGLYTVGANGTLEHATRDIVMDFFIFCKLGVKRGVFPKNMPWPDLLDEAQEVLGFPLTREHVQEEMTPEILQSYVALALNVYACLDIPGCRCPGGKKMKLVVKSFTKGFLSFCNGNKTDIFADVGAADVWSTLLKEQIELRCICRGWPHEKGCPMDLLLAGQQKH